MSILKPINTVNLNPLKTTDLMRIIDSDKKYLFYNEDTHKIKLNNGAEALKNTGVLLMVSEDLRLKVKAIIKARLEHITASYNKYNVACTFPMFVKGHGLDGAQYKRAKEMVK